MIRTKRIGAGLCVLLWVILFFFCSNLSANARKTFSRSSLGDNGQVIVVYDGDTIKIRFDDGRVRKARLIGIDAPEIEDEREEVKFLAYTAKRFAFFHLYRKRIRVEYDWERTDKYGRILVYVWTKEEGLFNEFILGEGYAFVFTKFPFKEEYRKRFIAAERQARNLDKGLWKKEPFDTITARDALGHVGELLSVRYVCADVRARGNFVYLNSSGDFSAVIPNTQISLFPDISALKGTMISVSGFLEIYKGKPQIMVFLPHQLDKISRLYSEQYAQFPDYFPVSAGR
ncbi:MAG: thermonuclease family protein [Candidatus Aminicenantes bacterium]|jgi:micrococcal nuclease